MNLIRRLVAYMSRSKNKSTPAQNHKPQENKNHDIDMEPEI